MTRPVRLIDSGRRPTTWQLAASAALVEQHRQGESADTLRFQEFPPAAILGRHQALAQEIEVGWCQDRGVEIARRITGGGAIVMGPGILGWELILPAAWFGHDLGRAVREICAALAAGLSGLGMDARFRPRNDIEVGGRKISGTGGYVDGRSLLFQGTVLCALDRTLLRQALRWPAAKLARHDAATIDARITDLATLLARPVELAEARAAVCDGFRAGLGLTFEPAALTSEELAQTERLLAEEIGAAAFIQGDDLPAGARTLHARHAAAGAGLEALIRLRPGDAAIIERALIQGDFFVTPPRVIADLEAALQDLPLAEAPAAAAAVFAAAEARCLGCTPADFAALLAAVGPSREGKDR